MNRLNEKKEKRNYFFVWIIIFTIGGVLQCPYINEFPRSIHAWAQLDRYSIALGFIHNNFNLFKPETFVLNHQFPGDWLIPSSSSITAVDLPIHDFLVACFMKLFGTTDIYVFRMYTLLYSFVGQFFLFKLSYLLTKNYFKSVFVLIFAATAPLFIYYENSSLPTIPSLANVIIGLYFYCKYLHFSIRKDFSLSVLFLTLATLNRSTFAIVLIAVLGTELLRIIKRHSLLKDKLLSVTLSALSIIGYAAYNSILREKYGSIFLSELLPAKNWEEAKEILNAAYEYWFTWYLSGWHYYLLGACLLLTIVMVLLKKGIKQTFYPVGLLILLIFTGYFVFAILMLRQFMFHDYYFLDTFFLPLLLLLIFALACLPDFSFKYIHMLSAFFIALISIPLMTTAVEKQEIRYADVTPRMAATINNFNDAAAFLDTARIERDARILVLDCCTPNIPFVFMERKGYANMRFNKETVEQQLQWDADYVVIEYSSLISEEGAFLKDPSVLYHLDKRAGNGKIAICKVLKTPKAQKIEDFMKDN